MRLLNTGRHTETLLWQKQSSQALKRLKIALDWQPNCCHYSFHHFYQPCGAHAVGGQSSCFHGAFHASPSTQLSRYPLISSFFSKSCPLLPLCNAAIPFLYVPPSPHLFSPVFICRLLWKRWWVTSNTAQRRRWRGGQIPEGNLHLLTSWNRVIDWEGLGR